MQAPDGTRQEGYFQKVAVPDTDQAGKELFARLKAKYPHKHAFENSNAMLEAIKFADPALLWSSKQFRAMRRSCTAVAEQSAKLYQRAKKNSGAIRPQEMEQLLKEMKNLSQCAKAYVNFKDNQCIAANRSPNERERARMSIALSLQARAPELVRSTARYIDAVNVRENGVKQVDQFIRNGQAQLLQRTGESLKTAAVQLIYLRNVSHLGATGVNRQKLAELMTPTQFNKGVNEVRESGAFRNLLSSHSEAELKMLATSDGAGKLFDLYLESDLTKAMGEHKLAK